MSRFAPLMDMMDMMPDQPDTDMSGSTSELTDMSLLSNAVSANETSARIEASTSVPPEAHGSSPFQKLPPEIRLMIWDCMILPRLVGYEVCEESSVDGTGVPVPVHFTLRAKATVPIVLQICAESRLHAIKKYTLIPARITTVITKTQLEDDGQILLGDSELHLPRGVYLYPEIDTVYLYNMGTNTFYRNISCLLLLVNIVYFNRHFDKIQHLVVETVTPDHYKPLFLLVLECMILALRNLKSCIRTDSGKIDGHKMLLEMKDLQSGLGKKDEEMLRAMEMTKTAVKDVFKNLESMTKLDIDFEQKNEDFIKHRYDLELKLYRASNEIESKLANLHQTRVLLTKAAMGTSALTPPFPYRSLLGDLEHHHFKRFFRGSLHLKGRYSDQRDQDEGDYESAMQDFYFLVEKVAVLQTECDALRKETGKILKELKKRIPGQHYWSHQELNELKSNELMKPIRTRVHVLDGEILALGGLFSGRSIMPEVQRWQGLTKGKERETRWS